MKQRFRQPLENDRSQILIVLAIMIIVAVMVGIVPAVMPART